MHFWTFVTLAGVAMTTSVAVAQPVSCNTALVWKDGSPLDRVVVKASSTYYQNSLLASEAGLDGDSGWCPRNPISLNKMDYIQVDMDSIHRITAIDLQGRYVRGRRAEFADRFTIEYQTLDSLPWVNYTADDGKQVFAGNIDSYNTVRKQFIPPIRAGKIRIFPLSKNYRIPCLRFELYGCPETVNEIIINSPTEVKSVAKASENCNTQMTLDTGTPPSTSISWCSTYGVYTDMKEWVELDFGNLRRVTAIETQAWYDQRYAYADSYFVHYQRVNSDRWIQYKNRLDAAIFEARGKTARTAVKNILDPGFVAKRMRVIPYSTNGRSVCMTVTLDGCRWSEAVMSYAMPQGDQFGCADMGTPFFFYDYIYDGLEDGGKLNNGLGQLTDNIEGLSDFTVDSGYGKSGYEWVGWSNDTLAGSPVELVFEFDSVRDFSVVRFHVNNMFSRRVHAFRRAVIQFSVGGLNYQEDIVQYENVRDIYNEQARTINIDIVGRVGRYVKVQLYFDATWMMVSEVRFESLPNSMENVFINYM